MKKATFYIFLLSTFVCSAMIEQEEKAFELRSERIGELHKLLLFCLPEVQEESCETLKKLREISQWYQEHNELKLKNLSEEFKEKYFVKPEISYVGNELFEHDYSERVHPCFIEEIYLLDIPIVGISPYHIKRTEHNTPECEVWRKFNRKSRELRIGTKIGQAREDIEGGMEFLTGFVSRELEEMEKERG